MLDLLYGTVIKLRNAAFDRGWLSQKQASIPVVSVGNIQVGGTGKTPLAAWIMSVYAEQGLKVGYLSRGYGRKTKGFYRVEPQGDWQTFGDEALQIANRFPSLPVGVCEDRATGVDMLHKQYGAEVVVLDDAFQHRRLLRDFDIVSIDVSRPWQKDRLLPFGRLREPRANLHRADFIVASKLMDKGALNTVKASLVPWEKPMACCRPVLAAPVWVNQPSATIQKDTVLFSGLGNNALFKQNVQGSGLNVLEHVAFPDHHPYSKQDILKVQQVWKRHAHADGSLPTILTTEKDYFRTRNSQFLSNFEQATWGYLPMELEWLEGSELLKERLLRVTL
ncbi:MAG: tetraacyldisaccharide 4'-kinase [Bacteroidia bacterium]